MFYSLFGRVVWFALKLVLRRKYGRAYAPKSLLAGGTVALVLAVAFAFLRSGRDSE